MQHLLGIQNLDKQSFLSLLSSAESMIEISSREIKKVPALRGKTIVSIFFESSTRTRTSFEIAAKRLSADVINVSASSSSVTKGETLYDTARTIEAMSPDAIVIRHPSSGAPEFLAQSLRHVSVINAGDGMHEHPTQALLDCLTLLQHFRQQAASSSDNSGGERTAESILGGLKIAIVGDVLHSRVARSNVWAHLLLGNSVTLVGPSTLLPSAFVDKCFIDQASSPGQASRYTGSLGVTHNLLEGIAGADVVMCLRVQTERQSQFFIPSLEEYARAFCVSEPVLKKAAPNAVVLHPGPTNRGIEVSSEVIDGPRSLVQNQVANGVAVRMATLFHCVTDSQALREAQGASHGGSLPQEASL